MKQKVIYWLSTSLLCVGMLGSGISQLLHVKEMDEIISHLGYPLYLMSIIGVWKILGVIVLLLPGFKLMKEWAYAGFFFLLTGALISHLIMGDAGKAVFGPLFQTMFACISWYFRPANRSLRPQKQAE